MEITKPGAQSFRIKMRNAELSLKGATVIYARLTAAWSEIARAIAKVRQPETAPTGSALTAELARQRTSVTKLHVSVVLSN